MKKKNRRPVVIPSKDEVEEELTRLKQKKKYNKTLINTVFTLIVVAAIAVILATKFLPVLEISGSSMEPTLEDGQVVVLFTTNKYDTGDLCGFYWQNKLLIKRIIAGPGDIVDMDDDGNVYVNNVMINEPYVDEKAYGDCDVSFPYQVPENRYFVMGDHRAASVDSRNTTIGCIDKEQFVGKIFFRILPINKIGIIK